MKKIKLIFTLATLAFLAGCAAGVNFKKNCEKGAGGIKF